MSNLYEAEAPFLSERGGSHILIPAELHEARLFIEALCKFRKGEHPSWGDHEIDILIQRVMSHMGFPTAKTLVPEVYIEYYPDGPPKIRPWR